MNISTGANVKICAYPSGKSQRHTGGSMWKYYVDTEHMLLGILGDDNSLVSQYFFTMGVDAAAARRQITGILRSGEGSPVSRT